MTPGTIVYDPSFQFEDGKIGKKLLVILTDGCYGDYVVAKTTSNGDRFGLDFGCQPLHRYPHFFLPEHASCLKKNTWIQLHVFYNLDYDLLNEKIVRGAIHQIGALKSELCEKLLICATHSEDVTGYQEREIQTALSELQGAD